MAALRRLWKILPQCANGMAFLIHGLHCAQKSLRSSSAAMLQATSPTFFWLMKTAFSLPKFSVISDLIVGNVKCIGYTIKSVGSNRSKGTLCQQAQDVTYQISGVQRALAGKLGSATFPRSTISIWDRGLLVQTCQEHPSFSISED